MKKKGGKSQGSTAFFAEAERRKLQLNMTTANVDSVIINLKNQLAALELGKRERERRRVREGKRERERGEREIGGREGGFGSRVKLSWGERYWERERATHYSTSP